MDKRPTLQDLIKRRQAGGFVGRRAERAQFQENLRLSVEDLRRKFLFSIHGDAGVGKTFLLRQFTRIAGEHGYLTAYVDESVYDVPTAMETIATDLAQQGRRCKELTERLGTRRRHRHDLAVLVVSDAGPPRPAVTPGGGPFLAYSVPTP